MNRVNMNKTLSDNDLEKIKQARLAVAMKKLQAGGSLTLAEVRLIEEMKEGGRLGTAPTIAVASKRLSVPVVELKAAKRAGCPGFKHSRVDCDAVKSWLEKNPIKIDEHMRPMERQKFRKLKADADAKEFQLQVRKGEYLPRSEVRSMNTRAVATARSVMHGKASGLALVLASLTGADPVAIEERIKESFREIIAELHRAPCVVKTVTCKQCGKETGIE